MVEPKTKEKTKPNARTVGFKESLYDDIMKEFGGKDVNGKDKKFNAIVLEMIKQVIQKQKMIKKICPYLEFRSVTPTEMTIKDNHSDQLVEVSLRDDRFWCSECKPRFCMHDTFAVLHLKAGSLVDQDGKKKQ